MRTTLTLDKDVAAKLLRLREKRGQSLKRVVNDALRAGLPLLDAPPARKRPDRIKPVSLGGCLLPSLDNIGEVLALIEGEDHK